MVKDDGPEWHGGSDKEWREYKKARREWTRWLAESELAGELADERDELAEIEKRKSGAASDREFEKGVEDIVGAPIEDIRKALTDDNLTIAEKAARDALKAADSAFFFKASKQRNAQKKIKKARGAILKRSKKGKLCLVFAIAGTFVGALEVWMIASGIVELAQAVTP